MELSEDELEKAKFINFLKYYDLEKHHESFVNKLGVHKVSHLKLTKDEDLKEIGLTRPEIARLRQKMKENFSTVGKLKKKFRGKDHTFDTSPTTEGSPGNSNTRRGSMVFDTSYNGAGHPRPSVMDSPIVISSSQIQLMDKIGIGSNGSVHEAEMKLRDSKLRVAVKCITALDESAMTQFMKEAESMVQLNHPHIIKLYGISIGSPLMIIEELAPLGSLNVYLKSTNSDRVHLGNLYTFVVQISSAMCYLEEKRVVHRDLATRNVLVSTPDLVKLGDFGLARRLTEYGNYQLTRNVPLPTAWMPPEAISNGVFSTASDVWSFGVLMWELYSKGEKPWEGYRGREIVDQLEVGKQLEKPNICPKQVYQLMKSCWELRPTDRPSFAILYKKLLEPQYRPEVGYVTKSHSVDDESYLNKDDLVFVIDKYPRSNLCVGMTLKGEITTFRNDYVKMDFMRINKDHHTTDVPVQQQQDNSESRDTRSNSSRRESTSSDTIPSHYETTINNPGVTIEEGRESTENNNNGGIYSTAEEYDEQSYDQQSHDQSYDIPCNQLSNDQPYDTPFKQLSNDQESEDEDFYVKMRSPGDIILPPPINIIDKPTELDLPKPLSPTPIQTTPNTTPKNIPKVTHDYDKPLIEHPPVGVASGTSHDIDKESLYYYITRSQASEPCNVPRDPPPIPPRVAQKTPDESPPLIRPSPPKPSPSTQKPRPSSLPTIIRDSVTTVESNCTFDKESLYKVIFKDFPNTSRSTFDQIATNCDWNIDSIRDKLKIQQLMDMHLPYIEEKDCVRALEHCQGKVDRAAAWLIDLSDTISDRRNQV